ncbi:MAG TPA: rhomboid family intramembrane serine protease [Bacteroidales bacterium]|nr:rhomboid family intramembrane serine protease [Bacteroidales bacterium]HQI69487.1 rhomboid family intramembrane serine protease [Bacteroidales bacterium]
MNREYTKMLASMMFPFAVVIVMWLVKIIEYYTKSDFSMFGIMPLTGTGLIGVVTAPFVHADFGHLIANTIPMFVTLSIIFFFYKEVAYNVFLLVWLFTGVWVWSFARGDAYHIGASGLVYGYVSFLLFSGIIRRNARLMAISLLIVFLYGGFFWGMFPDFFPKRNISWESHLMGCLAGFVLAVYYRKKGLQRDVYHWDEDDDEEDDFLQMDDEYSGKQE